MIESTLQIHRKKDAVSGLFRVRSETSDIKAIEEVWKKNSYQRKDFRIGGGSRWLDLGANVGAFSVYAGLLGNDVMSFEAEPENAKRVVSNMVMNGLRPNVHQAAIMDDDCADSHISFYVSSRPMALRRHSVYEPKKDFEKITVPVVRWSTLPFDQYPNVKMNIEGSEIALLEQAKSFDGIKKLVFEYSWDKDPSIPRFNRIIEKLRGHFREVTHNKKIPPVQAWPYYPPNIFVYCR